MKDRIYNVAVNHTESKEVAKQLTNELWVLFSVMGRYSIEIVEFDELPYLLKHKIITEIEEQLDKAFIEMGFDKKPEEWQYRDKVEWVTKITTYYKEGNKYFCADLKDMGFYNAP